MSDESSGDRSPSKTPVSSPPPLPRLGAKGKAKTELGSDRSGIPTKAQVKKETETYELGDDDVVLESEEDVGPGRFLIDACEAELKKADDELSKARLHYEIARAYDHWISDAEQALTHYQKAIECHQDFLPAIQGARRRLVHDGKIKAALPLFDAELRLLGDRKRKSQLLAKKGRILEDAAKDRNGARKCYEEAVELDPSHQGGLRALVQVEGQAESWSNVSKGSEKLAALVKRADNRAALTAFRARLAETRLQDSGTAIELYESALKEDQSTIGVLTALRRLLASQKQWQRLLDVWEEDASQCKEAGSRIVSYLNIARIAEDELQDQGKAIDALRKALELSPTDHGILEHLARLYEAGGDEAGLAEILERRIQTTEDSERKIALMHRLGQLVAGPLENPEVAIRWYEAALALDATYIPALRALGKLYADAGRWDLLLRMHLNEAEACEEAVRRADACARAASVLESHLGKGEEAIQQYERALNYCPSLESARKALEKLFTRNKNYEGLIELYHRECERNDEADLKVAYLFKIGFLYEDALRQPEQAVAIYRELLLIDPVNIGAIHAWQRAAESAGRTQDLVEALEREAKLSPAKERKVGLIQRAGEVLEENGDEEAALDRFRRALELDKSYVPALASLGRLYHKGGRWYELIEVFEREFSIENEKKARLSLLFKMGDVCEHQLNDDARAIHFYRRAIEEDASYEPARSALIRLLYRGRDWIGAVELYEAQLKGAESHEGSRKALLWYEIGQIQESHLQNLEKAEVCYQKASEANPAFVLAHDALVRVQSNLRRWKESAQSLLELAKVEPELHRRTAALMRSAEIYQDYLADPKQATEVLESLRQLKRKSLAPVFGLEFLYRNLKDWPKLIDVLQSERKILEDPDAKLGVLHELARVLEHQGGEEADYKLAEVYTEILELDGGDRIALAGLEKIAVLGDDVGLKTEIESLWADAEEDDRLIAEHKLQLAMAKEPKDQEAALVAYREANQRDATRLSAIRGVARLCRQQGDLDGLVEAIHQEADWTRIDNRSANLLVEAASVRADQMGQRGPALADLERALEKDPGHRGAEQKLSELLAAASEIPKLIEWLSRAAARCESSERRAELWLKVAQLYMQGGRETARAISALSKVLDEQPRNLNVWKQRSQLYMRNLQWKEAAAGWDKLIELKAPPEMMSEALYQLAEISSERLHDDARAKSAIDRLLRIQSKHRKALLLLAEIHMRKDDLNAAIEASERLVKVKGTDEEEAAAFLQLARARLKNEDSSAAAEAFRSVVERQGPDSSFILEYRSLLGNEEPWSSYAGALDNYLQKVEDAGTQEPQHWRSFVELAAVQDKELNQREKAQKTLERGLRVCGEHDALVAELAELERKTGDPGLAEKRFLKVVNRSLATPLVWRGLSDVWQQLGRTSESTLALEPLIVLGEASARERENHRKEKTNHRPLWQGTLSSSDLQVASLGPAYEPKLGQTLNAMADALSKLFPPDLSALGGGNRARARADSESQLKQRVEAVAKMCGASRYELALRDGPTGSASVELTSPPTLLVSTKLLELSPARQVFHLARPLSNIARGLHAAPKLGSETIHQLIAALVFGVDPNKRLGGYEAASLADWNRRIFKATPWLSRRGIEDAARELAALPELRIRNWVEEIEKSSARIAALLANDLVDSVQSLRESDAKLASFSGGELARRSPVVSDLLQFWTSDTAFQMRKKLGFR